MPHSKLLSLTAQKDTQRKERNRYLASGIIAVVFTAVQHTIAYHTGSEALHADAWHMGADALQSVVALLIVSGVLYFGKLERKFRKYGGFVQATTMVLAAGLVFGHLKLLGVHPTENFVLVTGTAVAATVVGVIRFRILHNGMPHTVFVEAWRALWSGDELNTTYLAELLHVTTDIGMSLLAVTAGIAGLAGWAGADEIMAWVIFCWLIACGLIIAVFAGRHSHDHDCGHHHH